MTPGELLAQAMHEGRLLCNTDVTAAVFDMTPWSVYKSVREGTFPIEPIRIGRKLKWRVADLAALVGAS